MTAMRFSLMFSGCFVSLLIWAGCTTVDCLVDKKMEPATTVVHPSSQTMISNAPYGNRVSFACETGSHKCMAICAVCYSHPVSTMDCLAQLLGLLCVKNFTDAMEALNSTNWCIWGNVNSLYSKLSNCTEEIFDCLLIPWPNPLVEHTFVDIHTKYFKDCPTEELSDPPPVIVFALVITPICLIPVMVCIVVLKTKNGDGSS